MFLFFTHNAHHQTQPYEKGYEKWYETRLTEYIAQI
jgi:hypothetical protein